MSMSRRATKKGADGIRVYNTKLFAELCRGVPEETQLNATEDEAPVRDPYTIRMNRIRNFYNEEAAAAKKKAAENLEDKLKAAKTKKDLKFKVLYKKIQEGKELVDSIDKFIQVSNDNDLLKKEKIYTEWESQVFNNIQKAMGKNLAKIDHRALNKRRRDEFQKFLDVSNSKGGLFLDTIVDDYDPLVVNKMTTKSRTSKLFDPTKRIVDKHNEESALLEGTKGKIEPKEREILSAQQWGFGKIEATPHGHFAKFIGKVHAPTEMQKKITKSSVVIDHYKYPTDGVKIKGGLRIFPERNNNHNHDFAEDY